MVDKKSAFREYLKSKGLKFTPERRVILEEILSMPGHFDIEKIYSLLHRGSIRISLATIYRTLPHLIDAGLIKEVMRCQDRPQYEVSLGIPHHDHLVCIACGRIYEFKDDRIERLQEEA